MFCKEEEVEARRMLGETWAVAQARDGRACLEWGNGE